MAATPATIIAYKGGRTLRMLFICAGFIALATWIALDSSTALALRWFMGFGAAFFAAGAVVLARTYFGDGPGLILDDFGLEAPRWYAGKIPWQTVTDFEREVVKGTDFLSLKLSDDGVAAARRRALVFLAPSRKSAVITLSSLEGAPDAIAAEVYSRWRKVRPVLPPQPAAPAFAPAGLPIFTYGLLALLVVVYLCELAFPIGAVSLSAPSVQTLAYDGGILGQRIWNGGDWWRLFTAPLLHANIIHILFNGFVLFSAGSTLEKLVGRASVAGLFAISAVGGALVSASFLSAKFVGVGASGGIMGLLAAIFVIAFRLPKSPERSRMQSEAARLIIPALLPFLTHARGGQSIDYFAHAGGALAGGALGLLLIATWPRNRPRPRLAPVFGVAAFGYFMIAAGALYPILRLRGVL